MGDIKSHHHSTVKVCLMVHFIVERSAIQKGKGGGGGGDFEGNTCNSSLYTYYLIGVQEYLIGALI